MNHNYMTMTPERLRVIRSASMRTQQQLADLISVDRSTIARIEGGCRPITPEIRRRLELTLGWNDPELQNVMASIQAWRESIANG